MSYPVVSPDAVVYRIAVVNHSTGFRWEGELSADGHLTETSGG